MKYCKTHSGFKKLLTVQLELENAALWAFSTAQTISASQSEILH